METILVNYTIWLFILFRLIYCVSYNLTFYKDFLAEKVNA